MYKIIRYGKRFNTKTFETYEDARKYVRRKITQLYNFYFDDYSWAGFKVEKV